MELLELCSVSPVWPGVLLLIKTTFLFFNKLFLQSFRDVDINFHVLLSDLQMKSKFTNEIQPCQEVPLNVVDIYFKKRDIRVGIKCDIS